MREVILTQLILPLVINNLLMYKLLNNLLVMISNKSMLNINYKINFNMFFSNNKIKQINFLILDLVILDIIVMVKLQ